MFVSQVDQKFVGAGIDPPDDFEKFPWSSGITGIKNPTGHNLEKITLPCSLPAPADLFGILSRSMVHLDFTWSALLISTAPGLPFQAQGVLSIKNKIILPSLGDLFAVVDQY